MNKKALILYSGGKDSHLALLYAVKKGFEPLLFHIDAGNKKHKFFSNYVGADIIEKHVFMMRLSINMIKIKTFDPVKIFGEILNEAVKKIKPGEKLFYFSSNDYQEKPKDKKVNRKFMNICKAKKVNFIPFTKVIGKDDVLSPIQMCLKNGVKSVIVSLEREFDKDWLLKPVDSNFAKMIKTRLKAGDNIDGNSYQSLVIESPLFGKKKLRILKTKYAYDPKDIRHFAVIKKYSVTGK